MEVDAAFELASTLLSNAESRLAAILTEEDAKVQVITRLLTEVLGWSHNDIASETANQNGFSDYLIRDSGRDLFLIEAKRAGAIDVSSNSTSRGYYKISGPVLKPAHSGIRQAASYCHPLGVPLAVVTDGQLWIIFLPWVAQASYADRQAVVFPNMKSILDDFPLFFELLSKKHVMKGTYRVVFDSIHENRLVLDRELTSVVRPAENVIVAKSGLAFDIEQVFARFFSSLTGDEDPEMLIECFVETRESRVADFSLERLTKNVLGNIDVNERDVGVGLKNVVTAAIGAADGQTIFIVGPSGAGKSTFLDRFFERTLTPEIRARCVVIKIDTLDVSGDGTPSLANLTEAAINVIEHQLFAGGSPTWNDLQALYHTEYVKRSNGVDSFLYNRDKNAFKEKFATYVEEQVERNRESYLRRLLADVVKNRKRLPVFVVDNTDEFELEFKASVFQYFQSLRRWVGQCLLIFPVTERSAWTFSRTEVFNIYSSRSFFLPTPSPREVFRKRVEYIRTKTSEAVKTTSEHMTTAGIRISISNLEAFAEVVETIFVNQDYAAKRVGELSNYNMREALRLAKRVITSSVFNIEDLVRSYVTNTMVAPSLAQFSNALLKGDYTYYKPGEERLLHSVFQVDSKIRQSPLLQLRILTFLRGVETAAGEDIERYMTVASVIAYLGVMAVPEAAKQKALETLLFAGLIEPYDPSHKDLTEDQRVALSYSGRAHLELAVFNPVFFEQYALTTRIADPEVASQIKAIFGSGASFSERMEQVRERFAAFLVAEDLLHCKIPERTEFRAQGGLSDEITGRWVTIQPTSEEMWASPDVIAQSTEGIVEQFDHRRGYGFVALQALSETAFIHARTVEEGGFDDLYDGDEIVCDVATNAKGFVVSKIISVRPVLGTKMLARVIKLVPDRGFGFVALSSSGAEAFFHYSLIAPDEQHQLREGQDLHVEIKFDKAHRAQVRRIL